MLEKFPLKQVDIIKSRKKQTPPTLLDHALFWEDKNAGFLLVA